MALSTITIERNALDFDTIVSGNVANVIRPEIEMRYTPDSINIPRIESQPGRGISPTSIFVDELASIDPVQDSENDQEQDATRRVVSNRTDTVSSTSFATDSWLRTEMFEDIARRTRFEADRLVSADYSVKHTSEYKELQEENDELNEEIRFLQKELHRIKTELRLRTEL